MIKRKRMGRPPAPWMYQLEDLKIEENRWVSIQEISDEIGVHINTAKSFLRKREVKRKHEVINGRTKMKFKVKDLKKAAKEYITPWR